jgi:hypothetical protein
VKCVVRNRGREDRVLKNGCVVMHVDRVVMRGVVADEGEGVGGEIPEIEGGGEEGVTRGGDELSLEERNRVEGAAQIEEVCRHCLTLSLPSSRTGGEVNEEVEEVEGEGRWT